MDGVYLTWLISALAVGVFLMPYFKPPWARLTLSGFVDFIRRYWLHLLIALSIYNAKAVSYTHLTLPTILLV